MKSSKADSYTESIKSLPVIISALLCKSSLNQLTHVFIEVRLNIAHSICSQSVLPMGFPPIVFQLMTHEQWLKNLQVCTDKDHTLRCNKVYVCTSVHVFRSTTALLLWHQPFEQEVRLFSIKPVHNLFQLQCIILQLNEFATSLPHSYHQQAYHIIINSWKAVEIKPLPAPDTSIKEEGG